MNLKGRLKLIADKIPKCNILCDIGTDHGYIPVYAVKNKLCNKALACDVKKGPLKFAEANVKKYGFEKIIDIRQGDGLEPVNENESDVVVIAGMGGELIKNILDNGIEKAKKAKRLILQPMNSIDEVRKWLYANGFDIIDEELINEGEKIYNVIIANWTGINKNVDMINFYIGEKLIEKKDPLLTKLLKRKINQIQNVLKQIENIQNNSNCFEDVLNEKSENLHVKENLNYLLDNYTKILYLMEEN